MAFFGPGHHSPLNVDRSSRGESWGYWPDEGVRGARPSLVGLGGGGGHARGRISRLLLYGKIK